MSFLAKFLLKKETQEYFLTLGVEGHRIQAAAVQVVDNQVVILGTGESDYRAGENETEAADIAVSTAEKNLPENTLVEKVIFALPVAYIEKERVKPEYLVRLKKITNELNLKPHGFVEYPAAISYYLEKQEGSPPTFLLLFVGREYLTFSFIRVGKIQQDIIIGRTSSSLSSDFAGMLSQFTTEVLPSIILLYDESENMEDIREELLRFPWNKYPTFLHTPKIEILPSSKILTALVEAAASSLIPNKPQRYSSDTKNIGDNQWTQEVAKHAESPSSHHKEDTIAIPQETFGFVKGKLGKIVSTESQYQTVSQETSQSEPPSLSKLAFLKIPKFSFKLPNFPSASRSVLLFIGILSILIITILSIYWFYPKATISLIVYPTTSNQQVDVVFTTSANKKDGGKNIILSIPVSDEASGEKTTTTSGKNKVGDKARGEVTVYNKTLERKTFPKGAILTNGNLKFTLDDDVILASASDTGEGLSFGKVNVRLTSTNIGPEGNLASGSIFLFKDFPESSYSAKNTQGFTGGSIREVTSVAKEDQIQLENSLSEELISQARQKLTQKLSAGEKLLESSIEKVIIAKKFSSEVGSEANELSLSLSLKVNALYFKESDLTSLTTTNLTSAPSGFTLDQQKTDIKITDYKIDKSDSISSKAILTAYFIPQINKEEIKSKLAGKTYSQVAHYLETIEHIGGVKITQDTQLPFTQDKLPISAQNITIKIIAY